MKFLRLVIISIIFFLIIITIISLFIPSHVRISRAIQIHQSKEEVMRQIEDPLNWKNWYPGADSARYFYEEGVIKGIILDEYKRRYLLITEKKDEEVRAAYTMPNKKVITGWQILPAVGSNSVTVQWYMEFRLHWYPWEKFSSFMFEKVYGPQMEDGLKNLKSVLEK